MILKEYVVLKEPNGELAIWATPAYESIFKGGTTHKLITTFNANEELKEGGLPQSLEEIITKEPVTFFLVNALKYLNEQQRIALRDALIERTPAIGESSAEPAGEGWVSVRGDVPLPDFDEPVLWYTESGNQFVAALDKDEWYMDFVKRYSVTHWRKLPNPPNTNI